MGGQQRKTPPKAVVEAQPVEQPQEEDQKVVVDSLTDEFSAHIESLVRKYADQIIEEFRETVEDHDTRLRDIELLGAQPAGGVRIGRVAPQEEQQPVEIYGQVPTEAGEGVTWYTPEMGE